MQTSIEPYFQDQALLFVSGGLPEPKRGEFELLLQCDAGVRHFVVELSSVSAPLSAAVAPSAPTGLKDRVMSVTRDLPQEREESLVLSGPDGLIRWVSDSFTEMCGYSREELVGKKPGAVLQGEKTDPAVSASLGRAVREGVACRETILNYHKDGRPYWVEIALTPVLDDEGRRLRFIAQEFERKDLELP